MQVDVLLLNQMTSRALSNVHKGKRLGCQL